MLLRRMSNRREREQARQGTSQPEKNQGLDQPLAYELAANLALVNQIMGHANDVIIKEFMISSTNIKAAVVAVRGLCERELLNEQVLTALTWDNRFTDAKSNQQVFQQLNQYGIPNILVREEANTGNIIDELIAGNAILFMEGVNIALIIGSQGWKDRSISEPMTENAVRGPREGFTETIDNNTALIRRRIKSPKPADRCV